MNANLSTILRRADWTLDGPDRGGNMAHTRAADDFQTIRARMEELRREREGATVTETDCGSVEPARRRNNAIFISLRRLLNVAGHPLARPMGQLARGDCVPNESGYGSSYRYCVFRGKSATDSGMKSATDSDLIWANPI